MAGRYRGVTQRGQGWQIAFTLPDQTRCREIVRFPHTRKGEDQANAIRIQVLAEIDRGTFDYFFFFPRSKKAPKYSRCPGKFIRIEDALRDCLQRKKKYLAYSSYYSYSSRVYHHLIPAFGHLSLSDLKADDIRSWMQTVDMSSKSINNTLSPLRDVFAEAYQAEHIDRNPLDRIPALPISTREPTPFTAEEIDVVLTELGKRSIAARDYFMFAFGTGLRTSELLALSWADIDLEQDFVVVTKAKVKGRIKKPKTASGIRNVLFQPLALKAIESLLSRKSSAPDVFIDDRTNRPWRSGQSLRKGFWYPALDSAGLKRRNPYQTRHTYASHLLSNGENPMFVAQQMGHADWGMIRAVYGRYLASD